MVALEPGIPTVAQLFTFMRDAELRFDALRMRIEEHTATARGDHLVVMNLLMRHPGQARVTTSEPERGIASNFDLWISDGETVRTYSAQHKLGTERPVRHAVRGLDGDFPGMSRVYWPRTTLPMETLPDLFVHPAGYCQNVLATGRCHIAGTAEVLDREAIQLDCEHPRTIEVSADRPDFRISMTVDRATGIITRLIESISAPTLRCRQRPSSSRSHRERRCSSSAGGRSSALGQWGLAPSRIVAALQPATPGAVEVEGTPRDRREWWLDSVPVQGGLATRAR